MAGIKQLPRMPQTGIASLDRHLQVVSDTLNPILRTISEAGLRQLLSSFTVIIPAEWTAPALLNSWTNVGSSDATAQYKIDALGKVTIHGYVTGGTAGSAIFTLPAGYRPAKNESFATTANNAFGKFFVASNGDVTHQVGSNTNVSIACSFWPDATNSAPIAASCWPVDVPHSLPSTPVAVLVAQCVDQSNQTTPPTVDAFPLQWTMTPGVSNSIRVLNIPGLVPTRTYSIQLLAFA